MAEEPAIGLLTFHRCFNYGSYWQARALLEGLGAIGQEAILMDHRSPRVERAERACGLHPTLPMANRLFDGVRYGTKILKFSMAIAALPKTRSFALEDPANWPRFDTVVVGSDEVWNLCHPWYGGCPLFFGEHLRASRLIAYAASFGSYDARSGLPLRWSQQLKHFQAISVRDQNSFDLIRSTTGRMPSLVLDPCLQFPATVVRESGRRPKEPFIAVYGHTFPDVFGRRVRRVARAWGVPLVSIGYRNPWADRQWLSAGPMDFVQAMSCATAVVTNFFHGCIFALRFKRPFIAAPSEYRSTKIRDLLSLLEADRHQIVDETAKSRIERSLRIPPSAQVFHRIAELRDASTAYLQEALR